jgi:hypothetical protein
VEFHRVDLEFHQAPISLTSIHLDIAVVKYKRGYKVKPTPRSGRESGLKVQTDHLMLKREDRWARIGRGEQASPIGGREQGQVDGRSLGCCRQHRTIPELWEQRNFMTFNLPLALGKTGCTELRRIR